MVSRRIYVDHLIQVDLFKDFTRKDLERVAASGVHMTVPAGTVLIKQEDAGFDAFIVLSGDVQIKRNGRTLRTVGPGTVLGELALLDHGPRTATATCVTECDVLVISRGQFNALVEQTPALLHKLLAALARRVRDLDSKSYG